MTFGQQVKEARGLRSQEEAARVLIDAGLKVSMRALAGYERGETNPDGLPADDPLTPLLAVAMETGTAVVASRHFRKGGGDSAEAGTGAVAVRALARSAHALGYDPEHPDPTAPDCPRIFAPSKSNAGTFAAPLAYRIDTETLPATVSPKGERVPPVEIGRVVWLGERRDVRADDLTAPGRGA